MTLGRFPAVAAFPLGGIGTGTVSIGARGEFRDWELENHPDKGRDNPNTFFAIHARPQGGTPITRVLESSLEGPADAPDGFGPSGLRGLPRLDAAAMRGEYPFVEVAFEDAALPVEVRLTAFTPLIPLDSADSGIPGAVLRYTVRNPLDVPVVVTVAGSISHLAGRTRGYGPWPSFELPQRVEWREDDRLRGLAFDVDVAVDDLRYGTLVLATTDPDTTAQPSWAPGFWADGAQLFWDDFATDGILEPDPGRPLDQNPLLAGESDLSPEQLAERLPKLRTGTLGIRHELASGESRDFEFMLAWSFPNRPKGWDGHVIDFAPITETARNFYATRWPDAWSAAAYLAAELPRLEAATRAFQACVHDTSLDPVVVDAITATIATLRSTTCFRIEDGTFLAWEGSFDQQGSCEGTCTHVWNYAQTVAWLFPDLERSARRVEFLLETDDAGAMAFRTNRVWDRPGWTMAPAVDGQLGTIVRLHREWRFSGDDAFLRELWPGARRALDFALREWDADGDGLLDTLMHNTYDIEFDGAEPLGNIMLLAALAAAIRMGEHLGDDVSGYREALARSSVAVDTTLYNGEYYEQRVEDVNARRYQYGHGVLSDQLLGQLFADLGGLETGLPREHVSSAIAAVFRSNFRERLGDHASTQRTFALGDEGGLLLASWPDGGRPSIPFIYSDEVWTGIEYQVAAELAINGMLDESVAVVRAVRGRYDGTRRSPWNEIECGYHYARSLASWAVLLAFSGVQYDGPRRTLSFDPPGGDYRGFFSTGSGWGHVATDATGIDLRLDHGALDLDRVTLRGADLGPAAITAGQSIRLEAIR